MTQYRQSYGNKVFFFVMAKHAFWFVSYSLDTHDICRAPHVRASMVRGIFIVRTTYKTVPHTHPTVTKRPWAPSAPGDKPSPSGALPEVQGAPSLARRTRMSDSRNPYQTFLPKQKHTRPDRVSGKSDGQSMSQPSGAGQQVKRLYYSTHPDTHCATLHTPTHTRLKISCVESD